MMRRRVIFLGVLGGMLFVSCIRDADFGKGEMIDGRNDITFVVSVPASNRTTRANDPSEIFGAGKRDGESGQISSIAPATRAIIEGEAQDTRVDEIAIVLFDAEGNYTKTLGVGLTNEPAISDLGSDASRKQFTIENLEDGNYTALFIANSRAEVSAYISANNGNAAKMTVAGFRSGLMVNHKLSATNPWNATPESADYRPFPMSSTEVAFTIPATGDRQPVRLMRALAKINVRSELDADEFEITGVMVCNFNDRGTITPAADASAVNPAGNLITTPSYGISYAATTHNEFGYEYSDCVDEIFVFEQAASDPANVTTTDWGKNNLCLIVTGNVVMPGMRVYGTSYRIDLMKDHDNDPDTKPRHIDVTRNFTYDISIINVNTRGDSAQGAYNNPPAGLEFEIEAHNEGDGNENIFNGKYQLTTDRTVVVLGPEAGATATVMVYTDYSGGWSLLPSAPMIGGDTFITTGATTSAGAVATPLTITAQGAWTGGYPRGTTFSIVAGELVKRMVLIQLPDLKNVTATSTVVTDYAGAFWKADQTGERLVKIKPNRKWSAFVLDPEGSGSWVVMDTKPSTDTGVNSASPQMSGNDSGFDSKHRVEGIAQWAGGTTGADGGYLRLGARNAYAPTTDAPARYAAVLVAEGNVDNLSTWALRILYLRQGHDPDYLMQPDESKGSNGGMASRPLARKLSPYNLTATAFLNGTALQNESPQIEAGEGVFTAYPTQAGAQFQFASYYGIYAFNPVSPIGKPDEFDASESVVEQETDWNILSPFYETCPEGYRRPTHGDNTKGTATADPLLSELSQSLFVDPTDLIPVGLFNSVGGYYADGYFDRRAVQSSVNNATLSAVSAGDYNVAYKGWVFYNTTTGASIFFPATGSRTVTPGGLLGSGSTTSLMSSSLYDDGAQNTILSVRLVSMTSNSHMPNNTGVRTAAHPIRCVANPDYTDQIDPNLVLAPPGVIGIKISDLMKLRTARTTLGDSYFDPSIKLTLRGSSTYKGTWVEKIATRDPNLRSLEAEPVYALYFKWGSTIGVTGQYDYAGMQGQSFQTGDAVWKNSGSTVNITNYGSIPAGINTGVGGNDDITYDPLQSRGDPCQWVGGATADYPSVWGTPAGSPWTYSDGSTPFGTYTASPSTTGPGWAVMRSSWGVAAHWTEQPGNGVVSDNGMIYLPAAGQRASSGTTNMNVFNPTGFYWTRTAESTNYGLSLYFTKTNINPTYRALVGAALPIRCVVVYTAS